MVANEIACLCNGGWEERVLFRDVFRVATQGYSKETKDGFHLSELTCLENGVRHFEGPVLKMT